MHHDAAKTVLLRQCRPVIFAKAQCWTGTVLTCSFIVALRETLQCYSSHWETLLLIRLVVWQKHVTYFVFFFCCTSHLQVTLAHTVDVAIIIQRWSRGTCCMRHNTLADVFLNCVIWTDGTASSQGPLIWALHFCTLIKQTGQTKVTKTNSTAYIAATDNDITISRSNTHMCMTNVSI